MTHKSPQKMRCAVAGANGRMGRALICAISETQGAELCGAFERPGTPVLGTDAAANAGLAAASIAITDNISKAVEGADCVLDFTTPQSTCTIAPVAAECGAVHIIGTTGLDASDQTIIDAAAQKITIVQSGNMSPGVNLLVELARQAASALPDEYDIEILEMHHRHKIDAPSGTALMLGMGTARGRGVDFARSAILSRQGHTGPRPRGAIGFATMRGGSVVGEHSAIFAGSHEQITLTHRASDRGIYASGALHAGFWAQNRPPGLYTMRDVLGLAPDPRATIDRK